MEIKATDEITIVTHGDLDGWASAHVISMSCPVRKVFYAGYESVDSIIKKEIAAEHFPLFITDITPSQETLNDLDCAVRAGYTVVLIDHHKTIEERLKPYDWAYFDGTVSGSVGTLNFLNSISITPSADVIDIATLADIWDTWKLDHPQRQKAEDLNRLFHFVGRNNLANTLSYDRISTEFVVELLKGQETRYINKWMEVLKKTSVEETSQGYKFFLILSEQYTSTLANTACNEFPVDFVAVHDPTRNAVELRSVGEFDVGLFAESKGGGGHKNAAGYSLAGETCILSIDEKIKHILEDLRCTTLETEQ